MARAGSVEEVGLVKAVSRGPTTNSPPSRNHPRRTHPNLRHPADPPPQGRRFEARHHGLGWRPARVRVKVGVRRPESGGCSKRIVTLLTWRVVHGAWRLMRGAWRVTLGPSSPLLTLLQHGRVHWTTPLRQRRMKRIPVSHSKNRASSTSTTAPPMQGASAGSW